MTLWLAKNNNWIDKTDIRAKENKILISAIAFMAFIACLFLAYLYLSDRSENTVSLIVMSIQIITFLIKFFLMAFVFIWVRWTLLRFRYDQLQTLGWKVLLPIAILNIIVSTIIIVV
jgi:NADH-quinone oxidoreductase subunit H